ncbi:MAG: hypothetical protein VX335_02565 [Pseudomonadota bacterium]|nr:hypothetical protein [Pseudomonadota bacterium]
MSSPRNKNKLFFRRVSYFLQKLVTTLALTVFNILKFIFAEIVYNLLILRVIYPALNWLITKPLYYLGFFSLKIVFGICDVIFAILYKLIELLLFVVYGIHKLFSYFFDNILMPIAAGVTIFLECIWQIITFFVNFLGEVPGFIQRLWSYCIDVGFPWIKNNYIAFSNNLSLIWEKMPLYTRALCCIIFLPIFALVHTAKSGNHIGYLKNSGITALSIFSFFMTTNMSYLSLLLLFLKCLSISAWLVGLYYAKDIVLADWDKIESIPVITDTSSESLISLNGAMKEAPSIPLEVDDKLTISKLEPHSYSN